MQDSEVDTKFVGQGDVKFLVTLADRSTLVVSFDDTVDTSNEPVVSATAEENLISAIEGGRVVQRHNLASTLRYTPVENPPRKRQFRRVQTGLFTPDRWQEITEV